jgi:hypothetical protein
MMACVKTLSLDRQVCTCVQAMAVKKKMNVPASARAARGVNSRPWPAHSEKLPDDGHENPDERKVRIAVSHRLVADLNNPGHRSEDDQKPKPAKRPARVCAASLREPTQ